MRKEWPRLLGGLRGPVFAELAVGSPNGSHFIRGPSIKEDRSGLEVRVHLTSREGSSACAWLRDGMNPPEEQRERVQNCVNRVLASTQASKRMRERGYPQWWPLSYAAHGLRMRSLAATGFACQGIDRNTTEPKEFPNRSGPESRRSRGPGEELKEPKELLDRWARIPVGVVARARKK